MNLNGKVVGFGKYTPAALEKAREDLCLTLPQNMLAYCANYYRTQEKRDPLIEELRMIDRLAALCRPREMITELLTNETSVARTYADAISKRRMLRPDGAPPITPEELFDLATHALRRVGKMPQLRGRVTRLEKGTVSLVPARAVGEASSAHFAESVRAEIPAPAANDLFVLIRPDTHCAEAHVYRDAVSALLEEHDVAGMLKKHFTVTHGGLLALLLSTANGAQIDLTRLSRTGEPLPPTMLVDAYADEHVILIARQSYHTLAQSASAHGLRLYAFASITGNARYDFFQNHDKPAFALDSAFLRSMIPSGSYSAALGDEGGCAADAPISHRTVSGISSKYLAADRLGDSETRECDGLLFASASVKPQAQGYHNAIDCALAPILALAASGADYPEVRLALSLERPFAHTDPSMSIALSVILGLYRTQTELGIPAAASQSLYHEGMNDVSLSVLAFAPIGSQKPNHLVAEGNGVYCLAPALDGDGQIDFEQLRGMLTYLTSIAKEGAIKSIRMLCREPITSALQAMSTDRLTCRVTDPIWVCEGALPLAILVEVDREIRAARIGDVVARETARTESETELPEPRSLLPTDGCSVTLITAADDADGINLGHALRVRGADTRRFTPNDPPHEIARALLTSDTLILCGSVSLPADECLAFAAHTFEAAGGLVLLLGDASSELFEGKIRISGGLTEKNLEKICKKRK